MTFQRQRRIFHQTLTTLIVVVFFVVPAILVFGQSVDTSARTNIDTIAHTDSTHKAPSGIDTVVNYSSIDSIVFSYDNRIMRIYGDGDVNYRTMGLKAERITVDWNENQMDAIGVLDTAAAQRTDSLMRRYTGTPILIDGGEQYDGWKVDYNFRSQKGRITLGETEMEQGFYYGQHIKKVEREMLFIADGKYTTCDRGHPHFYFSSPHMRITVRDKIVAKPIYLYVSDVPVFALPFGVFPSQGGRRSGIIAPAYGDDSRRGRFLQHFGYYWAMNDYMDVNLIGDGYMHGSWKASSQFRYAKRYDFSGSLYGEYSRLMLNEPGDYDRLDEVNYRANWRHGQQFDPTSRLDVDFSFASNNAYKASNNYDDYLRQMIYSNATYSKSWEGTNNSMSMNVSRSQDLQEGNIDATIPSLYFSHAQSYPFKSSKRTRGYTGIAEESQQWYELIGMSYSGQFQNINRKTKVADPITNQREFHRYERHGLNHSIGVGMAPKLGYFTIAPSISYIERWYDRSVHVSVDTANREVEKDRLGFEAVRFFSTGASASTKFYGLFQPPIPGVFGFRHTVTPSLSYTYQPDFSEPFWGYYDTYTDTNGRKVKYDRFRKEVYGGAPSGRSQSVGISVGNLFEMKTGGRDTSQKGEKYQLLNLGASLSYNFAADSLRLSDLSLSYRTDIGSLLGISGSSTYRFYVFDQSVGHRVNRFLLNEGKGIAEMTSFSVNVSTSLRGEKKQRSPEAARQDSLSAGTDNRILQSQYRSLLEDAPPDFSIPWNLSLNFSFMQNQENPKVKYRSANVNASLGFNLTENWKFTASGSYDLINKQFAAPRITIFRDLHCWEMNFSWSPLGQLAGYRFELRVKAPQLQDIKVTKQSRNTGFY